MPVRRRIGVVSVVAMALAYGAGALIAPAESDRDVDRFACGVHLAADEGCARAGSLVAARERAGWHCTMRAGTRPTSWECTRASFR
jgi:hypothetical protein